MEEEKKEKQQKDEIRGQEKRGRRRRLEAGGCSKRLFRDWTRLEVGGQRLAVESLRKDAGSSGLEAGGLSLDASKSQAHSTTTLWIKNIRYI